MTYDPRIPEKLGKAPTVIGVGAREIFIVLAGLALAAISFGSLPTLVLKIMGVLFSLIISLIFAFGRDPKTGFTYERWFLDWIGLFTEKQFYRKDAASGEVYNVQVNPLPSKTEKSANEGLFKVKPVMMPSVTFFQILSYGILILLLSYIWLGTGLRGLLDSMTPPTIQ